MPNRPGNGRRVSLDFVMTHAKRVSDHTPRTLVWAILSDGALSDARSDPLEFFSAKIGFADETSVR